MVAGLQSLHTSSTVLTAIHLTPFVTRSRPPCNGVSVSCVTDGYSATYDIEMPPHAAVSDTVSESPDLHL